MIRKDAASLKANKAVMENKKRCPVCESVETEYPFQRIGNGSASEAIRFSIRNSNLVRNDPSETMLYQTEMHVANALALLRETISAAPNTAIEAKNEMQIDARVRVEKNFAKIIVHLQFATDCASGFPDLHSFLLDAERRFEQEGIFPDLNTFYEHLKKEFAEGI